MRLTIFHLILRNRYFSMSSLANLWFVSFWSYILLSYTQIVNLALKFWECSAPDCRLVSSVTIIMHLMFLYCLLDWYKLSLFHRASRLLWMRRIWIRLNVSPHMGSWILRGSISQEKKLQLPAFPTLFIGGNHDTLGSCELIFMYYICSQCCIDT